MTQLPIINLKPIKIDPLISAILVIRPDAIGDVVLTLPVLNSLKSQYPNAKIVLWTQKAYRPLLENHPAIDEIINASLPKEPTLSDISDAAKLLRPYQFDMAVLPYLSIPLSIMVTLADIHIRIGDKAQLLPGLLMNEGRFLNYRDISKHVITQNLSLISEYILPENMTEKMDLYTTEEGDEKLAQKLQVQNYQNQPLIMIQPCTGGSDMQWPIQGYISVINAIHQLTPYHVILTGAGPNEEEIISKIKLACTKTPYTLTGFGTLPELKSLIKKAKVVIGTNTGPLHMAAALGTPVISLFPSKFIKPTVWGPWKVPHRIVRNTTLCHSICRAGQCHAKCQNLITSQDIIEALQSLLSEVGGDTPHDWYVKSGLPLLLIQKSDNIHSIQQAISKLSHFPKVIIAQWGQSSIIQKTISENYPNTQFIGLPRYRPILSAKRIAEEDIIEIHSASPIPRFSFLILKLIRQLSGLYHYAPPSLHLSASTESM